MANTLHPIRTFKAHSLLRQAGENAQSNFNSLRTERVKKRMVYMETNDKYWRASKMRHKMITCQDYISHKFDVFEKLDANLNWPRMHVVSHRVKLIC